MNSEYTLRSINHLANSSSPAIAVLCSASREFEARERDSRRRSGWKAPEKYHNYLIRSDINYRMEGIEIDFLPDSETLVREHESKLDC